MNLPKKLTNKLKTRKDNNSLRTLKAPSNLIDFSSNDYLGFAKSDSIFKQTHQFLMDKNILQNGATGSRLLSGNHALYTQIEHQLCTFHQSESALIFNSGYDANIGFFSSIPQRGDVILYDEFIHASIRDGIQLSNAKAYKFKHNDIADLENQIKRNRNRIEGEIYIVTESVFSMDGDSPDLKEISKVCKKHNTFLIVDEAHAVGVFGEKGKGIIQQLKLEQAVFARVITFGKALGCHGAAILGSKELQNYLVNFARSFIYTTGLSPHALATIHSVYTELNTSKESDKLHENIRFFTSEIKRLGLDFIESNSAIHCCVISGNEKVTLIAKQLQEKGFDVKPILSPTVPENQERLRFCLHSYNSEQQIADVLALLVTFVI